MVASYTPIMESAWYDWWDSQGFFAPQVAADGKTSPNGIFVMPLPPPTINGGLHLGHALTVTIEDVLCRWYVAISPLDPYLNFWTGIGCWAKPHYLFQDLITEVYRQSLWWTNGCSSRRAEHDKALDEKRFFKL